MARGRLVSDATPSETASLRPLNTVDGSELRSLLREQQSAYEKGFGSVLARGVLEVEAAVGAGAVDGFLVGAGVPRGYTFMVRDVASDLLSSLWVESGCVDVATALVGGVTRDARRRRRRLEAQDLGYGADDHRDVLASFATLTRRRLYMKGAARASDPSRVDGVSFRSFGAGDLSAVAAVSASAFADSPDVEFAASYRSVAGCLSRLFAATEGHSWGPLEKDCSPVALDRSGKMLGFALVTRMSAHVGHLIETAVLPQEQGRGLGRALLKRAVACSYRHHLREITLCVTEANVQALGLYRNEGFQIARDFCAHVLSTGKPRPAEGQNLPSSPCP